MTKERLNALKEQIKRFNFQFVLEIIEELEKENKELQKAITEKNSLIEKMKCCENCKHKENKLEDNEICWNCERSCAKFGEEIIKDEWELAEWKN